MSLSDLRLFRPRFKLFVAKDVFTKHIQNCHIKQYWFLRTLEDLLYKGLSRTDPFAIYWENRKYCDGKYSAFSIVRNDYQKDADVNKGFSLHFIMDERERIFKLYDIKPYNKNGQWNLLSTSYDDGYADCDYVELLEEWLEDEKEKIEKDASSDIKEGNVTALTTTLGVAQRARFYSLDTIRHHVDYLRKYSSGRVYDLYPLKTAQQVFKGTEDKSDYILSTIEHYEKNTDKDKFLFVNFVDESCAFSISQAFYVNSFVNLLEDLFKEAEFKLIHVIVNDSHGDKTTYHHIMRDNQGKLPLFNTKETRENHPHTYTMLVGASNHVTDILRGFIPEQPNHMMHFSLFSGIDTQSTLLSADNSLYRDNYDIVTHKLLSLIGSTARRNGIAFVNLQGQGLTDSERIGKYVRLSRKSVLIEVFCDKHLRLATTAAAWLSSTGYPLITIVKSDKEDDDYGAIKVDIDISTYVSWSDEEIQSQSIENIAARIATYCVEAYQNNEYLKALSPYGFSDFDDLLDIQAALYEDAQQNTDNVMEDA